MTMNSPKDFINTNSKVIWLTGLSASGKTTIAKKMLAAIQQLGIPCILLDGDMVREAIADTNCSHDPESRKINAYRISRLANMISRQGVTVIVATMSLFHEIHNWNRKNFPDYFEVYIKAELKTLKQRDPKGLYKHIEYGEAENLPGIDLKPEFPLAPDMLLENNEHMADVTPLVEKIIQTAINR